jgi:glutamate racemase
MIGLFDSGLGGLTVVKRVRERLPQADLLYLADQANVPYGNRDPQDLYRLLTANLAWLDEQGAEIVVIGCNTSCAIAERYGWPSTRAHVLDLIDSAATAVQRAGHKRIGAVPGAEVWEVAAPALVPLVEAGTLRGNEPREAVAAVCSELPHDLDAVIYGCTHYPLLEEHFIAALGPKVATIDPAIMQAERAAALLQTQEPTEGTGRTRYVTSGDAALFRTNVARIMNEPNPEVASK